MPPKPAKQPQRSKTVGSTPGRSFPDDPPGTAPSPPTRHFTTESTSSAATAASRLSYGAPLIGLYAQRQWAADESTAELKTELLAEEGGDGASESKIVWKATRTQKLMRYCQVAVIIIVLLGIVVGAVAAAMINNSNAAKSAAAEAAPI